MYRLLLLSAILVASATSLRAQDAFDELQGQVQQQLKEQGKDPSEALDLGGTDDQTPQADQPPQREVSKQRVKNPVAVFSGLDKITGKITSFDVQIDKTVQFGALQVTPRVCYTSPEGEPARTDAFVQVDEITLERKIRRIFSGWMFADSPGLNAVEHPVYDVWLKSCKTESAVPASTG